MCILMSFYLLTIYMYFKQNNIAEHKRTLTDTNRDFMDAFLHRMKDEYSSKTTLNYFTG